MTGLPNRRVAREQQGALWLIAVAAVIGLLGVLTGTWLTGVAMAILIAGRVNELRRRGRR